MGETDHPFKQELIKQERLRPGAQQKKTCFIFICLSFVSSGWSVFNMFVLFLSFFNMFIMFLFVILNSGPRTARFIMLCFSGCKFSYFGIAFRLQLFAHLLFLNMFVFKQSCNRHPGRNCLICLCVPLPPERKHMFYICLVSFAPGAKGCSERRGCTTLVLLSGAWNTRVVHPFCSRENGRHMRN